MSLQHGSTRALTLLRPQRSQYLQKSPVPEGARWVERPVGPEKPTQMEVDPPQDGS